MTVTVVDAGPRRVCRSVEVAAPAAELFAMAADPRRHHELDGSGTVRDNIKSPAKIAVGSKFSTKMKMYGVPYRITSTVTGLKTDELFEWRHPVGHRWRWEFAALSPTSTRVTETFDYHDAGAVKNTLKYYERMGFAKGNAAGIEATLAKLRDRYAGGSA
jgi:hypothetical protein